MLIELLTLRFSSTVVGLYVNWNREFHFMMKIINYKNVETGKKLFVNVILNIIVAEPIHTSFPSCTILSASRRISLAWKIKKTEHLNIKFILHIDPNDI